MNEYLYSNLVVSPNSLKNIIFGQKYWLYIITQHLPTIYGHAFIIIFFASFLFITVDLLINLKNRMIYFYKLKFFILLSFLLFFASFIPIKFYVGANRGLVLVPFMVLIIGLSIMTVHEKSSRIIRKSLSVFVGIILIIQIFESYMWVVLKHTISPQKDASLWIEKSISNITT